MAEAAEERHQRHVNAARIRGFVHVYDRTDWLLALFISLTTWVLLTVFSSPVLHPGFWPGVAVASGVRPPDSAASGLGLALANAIVAKFGVEGGVSALMYLGHVAGALIVGLCFLLMRGSFSARLSIKPEELLVLSPYLRALAVVGTIVFACSEALWIRMQFLSDELICLFLGTVAIMAFDRFRRHRRLGWHCLCSLATGLLAAETPVGFVLAAAIWLWNRREKKRYWARKGALKVLVRDPNDPDTEASKEKADAIVTFNRGKMDDPAAFFDDELEDEIKQMASTQETWLAALVFLTAFIGALVIGGRVFGSLGGLAVEDRTFWGYPVELIASWYRQTHSLMLPTHLLFTAVFSLFPFGIAFALVPVATDRRDKFRLVASLLVLLGGVVAWTQLSPFPDCWYWTWGLGGVEQAPESLRAFMAFFGAATLMAALQVACCACRTQVHGARKITVEEGVALARIRLFCRWLLAAVVGLVAVMSVIGRRQSDVLRKLELIDGYVKTFADQVRGLGWVFTDGAFDDALAVELKALGTDEPHPLSMMSGRDAYSSYLRLCTAEDDEDRRVLKVGTLETLRFWAVERKERLARIAMQLGLEVLVKCRVTGARSAGLALRIGTSEDDAAFDRADDGARDLCGKALAATGATAFGGFDQEVQDKFDFILWRLARMTELRMNRYLVKEDGASAARERELAKRLDAANGPYMKLKAKLERLGRDETLVLSPQEGLAVALKRGDFNLARPYANRMLRIDPDDLNANFAVGMWAIENKQYGVALKYLETAREKRPDEPSILNNLAMVRYKLGNLEEASDIIEHAVKVNPRSKEIQQNLKRIRDAIANGVETNAVAKATATTGGEVRRPHSQARNRTGNMDVGTVRARILTLLAALVALMVILAGAGWLLSKLKRKQKVESEKKTDKPVPETGVLTKPLPTVEEADDPNAVKRQEPPVSEAPSVVSTETPSVPAEAEPCVSDAAYAEKLWNEAREMSHNFIPDFMADRDYLSLLYRAAELGHAMASVKLGDYAYRRGAIVEAYYWTLMAHLRGATEVKAALEEMRKKWVQEGCPPEYENVREGFAEQQGVFARAVLRLRCGIDAAIARKRLAELEAAGCKEALLLKSHAP